MKVSKNGRVSLEKGEVRVGNFFIKKEPEYIKIQDINAVFTHRIRRKTAVGIWCLNMLDQGEGGERSLIAYIGTLWSVFSPAPDDEYVKALLDAATACLNRHPDWYGIKPDVTDEEDAAIIQEERELSGAEEEIKNLPDNVG